VKVLWLSDADVAALLSVRDALPLVEAAFAALASGQAQMPPKIYLDFREHGGDLRAMPAYLSKTPGGKPYAGVKVVNSHPKNPERGLPTVAATLVLNDPTTGMPLALMAAGRLTDARTGAAGGVAAKYLARPESSVVGLVGCGRQAVTQLEAVRVNFAVREVRVAGRDRVEAEQFCAKHPGGAPMFVPCSIEESCRADIVITTTPARAPVVKAGWIRAGTHVNAIGADAPGKQEIESALLANARVVVDLAEQAFHSGEVNVPLSTGALTPEKIVGNLGDIVTKNKKGRLSPRDVTVFDSTGLAVQDIAAAAWVYEKAVEKSKGIWLEY